MGERAATSRNGRGGILPSLRRWMRSKSIPRRVRLWAPPAIGIPALLALGVWGGNVPRFLLFTHHLFYLFSAMLLINPVIETTWPSKRASKRKRR